MKKDLIFAPILLVIGAALCFLKFTGMPVHIAISVVGVLVLAAYSALTVKEWKIPALEIAMRVCYGIALITGIIVINVPVAALSVIHKIFAILFLVLLAALLIIKLVFEKKKA